MNKKLAAIGALAVFLTPGWSLASWQRAEGNLRRVFEGQNLGAIVGGPEIPTGPTVPPSGSHATAIAAVSVPSGHLAAPLAHAAIAPLMGRSWEAWGRWWQGQAGFNIVIGGGSVAGILGGSWTGLAVAAVNTAGLGVLAGCGVFLGAFLLAVITYAVISHA